MAKQFTDITIAIPRKMVYQHYSYYPNVVYTYGAFAIMAFTNRSIMDPFFINSNCLDAFMYGGVRMSSGSQTALYQLAKDGYIGHEAPYYTTRGGWDSGKEPFVLVTIGEYLAIKNASGPDGAKPFCAFCTLLIWQGKSAVGTLDPKRRSSIGVPWKSFMEDISKLVKLGLIVVRRSNGLTYYARAQDREELEKMDLQ